VALWSTRLRLKSPEEIFRAFSQSSPPKFLSVLCASSITNWLPGGSACRFELLYYLVFWTIFERTPKNYPIPVPRPRPRVAPGAGGAPSPGPTAPASPSPSTAATTPALAALSPRPHRPRLASPRRLNSRVNHRRRPLPLPSPILPPPGFPPVVSFCAEDCDAGHAAWTASLSRWRLSRP